MKYQSQDIFLLRRASRLASELAVLSSVRLMSPFAYYPCQNAVPRSPEALRFMLRQALSEIVAIEGAMPCVERLESLSDQLLSALCVERRIGADEYCSFALAADPTQVSALFVRLAHLIREGNNAAAELIVAEILRRPVRPSDRSRAYANLAVVHELESDWRGVRECINRAVEQPIVSPLAVINLRAYKAARIYA